MLKYIIITVILLVGVVVAFGAVKYFNKSNGEKVLDFMSANPDKCSLKLIYDGEIIVDHQSNKIMPLASTVKVIIAIEYAEQVAAGEINSGEMVLISDLDKYYVANTDGGAHMAWFKEVGDRIRDDAISIQEVAKGMIKFSSNANTEWLTDRLGIKKVNDRINEIDITDHTPITYIVSALFVGKEQFPELEGEALAQAIRALSDEEYHEVISTIHEKLKADTAYRKDYGDLGVEVQRVWSDRLPASTTSAYAGLMSKFNSRSYFSAEVQGILDDIMQWIFDFPGNSEVYEYFGMKGGSTAFVLTQAMYVTDKAGHQTELAYFFDDINFIDGMKLQSGMNDFHIQVIGNSEFRSKLHNMLHDNK